MSIEKARELADASMTAMQSGDWQHAAALQDEALRALAVAACPVHDAPESPAWITGFVAGAKLMNQAAFLTIKNHTKAAFDTGFNEATKVGFKVAQEMEKAAFDNGHEAGRSFQQVFGNSQTPVQSTMVNDMYIPEYPEAYDAGYEDGYNFNSGLKKNQIVLTLDENGSIEIDDESIDKLLAAGAVISREPNATREIDNALNLTLPVPADSVGAGEINFSNGWDMAVEVGKEVMGVLAGEAFDIGYELGYNEAEDDADENFPHDVWAEGYNDAVTDIADLGEQDGSLTAEQAQQIRDAFLIEDDDAEEDAPRVVTEEELLEALRQS